MEWFTSRYFKLLILHILFSLFDILFNVDRSIIYLLSFLPDHKATISPCGRYYFVQLAVGTKNKVYPSQDLLTIDLVQKKIKKRVSALHTETDITVLNVMPC